MFVGWQPRAAPGYDVTDGGDDDTKIVLEIVLVLLTGSIKISGNI